jgi:hypothetical protein
MLNGIIDSWEVRAHKVVRSSQSSGSSFIPCHSEERLEIKMLKKTLRQRDEYYTQALAQQQAMLQVS